MSIKVEKINQFIIVYYPTKLYFNIIKSCRGAWIFFWGGEVWQKERTLSAQTPPPPSPGTLKKPGSNKVKTIN